MQPHPEKWRKQVQISLSGKALEMLDALAQAEAVRIYGPGGRPNRSRTVLTLVERATRELKQRARDAAEQGYPLKPS